MKIVNAKFSPKMIAEMNEVIKEGWYASKSGIIRDAVRELLKRTKAERLETAIKEDINWGLNEED